MLTFALRPSQVKSAPLPFMARTAPPLISAAAYAVACTTADLVVDSQYDAFRRAQDARDLEAEAWSSSLLAEAEDDAAFDAWMDENADRIAADAFDLDRICAGVNPC